MFNKGAEKKTKIIKDMVHDYSGSNGLCLYRFLQSQNAKKR